MAKRKGSESQPKRPNASAIDMVSEGSANRSGKIGKGRDGEPNEVHLAWYREWTVFHRSIADIARDANVDRSTTHEAIHKVKEWMKLRLFDNIVDFRHRQTQTLESMIAEALVAWSKSKEIGVTEEFESVTVDGETEDDLPRDATKIKRKEVHQCGSASFLAEARSAMSEIREIWGVNMPKKIAVEMTEHEGLIDPVGMEYEDAVIAQAHAIIAATEDKK